MIFQKDWYDAIMNDPYVTTSEEEMAYILYAAMRYSFYGECIDIGDTFGKEYKGLNRSMSNIYSQIDRIVDWAKAKAEVNKKYDSERIKELRLEGKTAREICVIEGYGEDKAKNITSNKGWKEAGEILKIQKNTENTDSVQKSGKSDFSVQNSVKSVQNLEKSGNFCTVQKSTDRTEICQNLEKSVQNVNFEF